MFWYGLALCIACQSSETDVGGAGGDPQNVGGTGGVGGATDDPIQPITQWERFTLGPTSYSFDVAVNANGQGLVAWVANAGAGFVLWASRFNEGRWDVSPTQLGADAGGPRVAIDSQGRGVIVWTEDSAIWASHIDATGFTSPTHLNDQADFFSFAAPDVVLDANGHGLAVWLQTSSTTFLPSVWASTFDGAAWSPSELVTDGNHYCYEVKVDAAPDGSTAAVVWIEDEDHDDPAKPSNVWSRSRTNESWGAITPIGNVLPDKAGVERLDFAMNSQGDAAVVWEERRPTTPESNFNGAIVLNRLRAGSGLWDGPVDVETTPNDLARSVSWPRVDIAPTGHVGVVWVAMREDGSEDGWFRYYDGEGLGQPAELVQAEKETVEDGFMKVALDATGRAWVVGSHAGNFQFTSWIQTFDEGGSEPPLEIDGTIFALDAAGEWVLAILSRLDYDGSTVLISRWSWAHSP